MAAAFTIALILMNFFLQNIESKTIPNCNGFICGDGTCVNGTRCDGVAQCADGSDELRCKRQSSSCYSSSSSRFRCSTSTSSSFYPYYRYQCISSSRRCDGASDCSDGSDERNCATYCYYCRTSSYSYSRSCSRRCDGTSECYDGSDEENCHTDDIIDDNSAIIGIIVGSTVGGLFFFICCPTVIITIVACAVYHTSRSGRTVITTNPTSSGDGTASAGATDQPGFQLQNLDLEKQAPQTAAADVAGAATAELTQPAPPPYTAPKPVLYLPTRK